MHAGYVENVFKKTFELCESGHSSREDASVHLKEPPPLSSQYTRPDKDTAISSHKSRYVYAKLCGHVQHCRRWPMRVKTLGTRSNGRAT